MGHYYFDLRDKRGLFPDEEGSECVDLDAVQDEAARSLADMAWDVVHGTPRVPYHQTSIEVRDDIGPVMTARFAFEMHRHQ